MVKNKTTPYQQELLDSLQQIFEYKLGCEANVVSILYQSPDELNNHDLKVEDFSNNVWKVYYAIIYDIYKVEKKPVADEITVGLYLQKHLKLKEKYEEYGGYNTITRAAEYIKIENLNGYVDELKKWNAVIKIVKTLKVPVIHRLSEFCDMTAEDIYNEYEALLNHIFVNVESDVKSYQITDGIHELIDELNEGFAVGLPYNNLPMITKETGGQYMGSITLVGGLSNVGKSTFTRTSCVPSILKHGEKIVIMLNEDGLKKYQREMLVWVANNILKKDIQKHIVRDGKYSEEVKTILTNSAKWLEEQAKNQTITIIPFEKYRTSNAIKIIKKYASMGIKYFILDTFKLDAGAVTDNSWLQMQQAMVEINDVIKPESKNLHIMITFQLNKGSARQRYYTMDNTGVAKNIFDVASTGIMIRDVLEDEYTGEKRELKVYRLEGKNYRTKIPVTLDSEKRYQIVFIVKNREGSANQFQVVVEHDMSRNILKEVGITNVPVDF